MQVTIVDPGGQKRASDLPRTAVSVAVNHLTWVLGTELWYFARAASILDCRAVFPGPCFSSVHIT